MPDFAAACDRRLDDLDLVAAEQPFFAGVRIEPGHANFRLGDAELLQRGVGDADDVLDAVARDQRQRLAHAHVQVACTMRLSSKQIIRNTSLTGVPVSLRDERRIAVEGNSRRRDRALGLRRRHHGFHFACQRRLDRAARGGERGAAVSGIHFAEFHRRIGSVAAVEQVDRAIRPIGLGCFGDHIEARRKPRRLGMHLHRRRIAHQQRPRHARARVDRAPP